MGQGNPPGREEATGFSLGGGVFQVTSRPQYALGIDLGTSHCALAFKKLDSLSSEKSQVLRISQWESETTVIESSLLPSWYYLTTKGEIKRGAFRLSQDDGPETKGPPYVVGRLARNRALQSPQRVIHSAKSWFVAGHVDRRSSLLPWGSDEIVGSERKSPVEVSRAYLDALKQQWNRRFPEAPFEEQHLTVTVPASFDEVAQRLTLESLEQCAFSARSSQVGAQIKLLEEPQAAFYAAMEAVKQVFQHPKEVVQEPVILVCDIGGGTSDFSLFKMTWDQGEADPRFTRIAVSEHILLGGDNIDLGLAHEIEKTQIQGEPLSTAEFQMLTHSVRQLKEDILGAEDESVDDHPHRMGIMSGGGSPLGQKLFQSARTVSITKKRMIEIINDGFFPMVPRHGTPNRPKGGLRQLGLPYAQDTGITRYLAEFLGPFYEKKLLFSDSTHEDQPLVNGVLLVGGTLKPRHLRERLLDQIEAWQGVRPLLIPINSMDLAIAEGAAFYGYLRASAASLRDIPSRWPDLQDAKSSSQKLIGGGYPRSLYLEVRGDTDAKSKLVCLVPQGYEGHHGEPLEVKKLPLYASVNQKARFQMWSSRLRPGDLVGDVISATSEELKDFLPLPPLTALLKAQLPQTKTKKDHKKDQGSDGILGGQSPGPLKIQGGQEGSLTQLIPVFLSAELADTGLLHLRCIPQPEMRPEGVPEEGWPLDFNLRAALLETQDTSEQEGSLGFFPASSQGDSSLQDTTRQMSEVVLRTIERVYGKKIGQEDLSPKGLVKELEKVMGSPRDTWDIRTLRLVWDHVSAQGPRRSRSPLHEATWMNLAGYSMRPGYGESKDPERMGALLRSLESGLGFSKERNVQEQLWILQRRVCGGMAGGDQDRLLARLMPMVRKNEAPSQEVYRLVGVLERADMQEKIKLGSILLQQIIAQRPPFLEQKVWTFGRIIGRTLLYAEVQHLLSPTVVAEWLGELLKIPPRSDLYPRLAWVLSQGARMLESREFNVDEGTRRKVVERLRTVKAPLEMIECVERFVPVDEKLKTQLFGEKLPLGLILG